MRIFPAHSPIDLVAVGDEGDRTWADLRSAAASIAFHLSQVSATEVVLACDDRYHFAAGLLGAFSARRRVILPANTQGASLNDLVSQGNRLLLHDRETPSGYDLRAWLLPARDEELSLPPDDEEVLVVTTSGSTGPAVSFPKALGQLLAEVESHRQSFGVARDSRVLGLVPPHHIYGLLWAILLPLEAGAAFVRRTPLHGEPVSEIISRLGVTHLVTVPAQLRVMATLEALPPVKRVFSAGSPLSSEVFGRIAQLGWTVTELYGSTETGGVGFREGPEDAWQPFPEVTVGLENGGRLTVESPFLHAGQERPFVTSDIARLTGDGFELLGRSDGIVKVGAKRVALAELEMRAAAVPGVSEARAFTREGAAGRGKEIWLVVVGRNVDPGAVRTELGRWLDPVAVPRRIRVVEQLPRDDNGKIPKTQLMALFDSTPVGNLRMDPEEAFEKVRPDGREEVTRVFSLTSGHPCFEGHFPGHPVLAGIVQLNELVLRQIGLRWPLLAHPRRVSRLKFKRVIVPGDRLVLKLLHAPGAERVEFEISSDRGSCSSGIVAFGTGEARP